MSKQIVRTERVGNLFQFAIWERKKRTGTGSLLWTTRELARNSGKHYLKTGNEIRGIDEGEEDDL